MELDKGGYVLVGVVVTLTVGIVRDVVAAWLKNRSERGYLSVQIIFLLDDFAVKCSDVVGDNGTYRGQYGGNGYARCQVVTPELNFSELKGDWKSLPPELVYKLHDFASSNISAKGRVNSAFEYSDPPDFDEGFEARQDEYALLGIQSFSIANEFRKIAKMPERIWSQFDPIEHMQGALKRSQERNKLREIAFQEFMNSKK